MAVKTKAVLLTESNSTFANASNITAAEHRAFNADIIDSYENVIPSLTTIQILAIASPTLRQIVFDTTFNIYYFFDGTRWVEWTRPKYKIYTALLTQTLTDAPVATVLENTLGGTVVWTRDVQGQYLATLTGAFTSGKTIVFIQASDNAVSPDCSFITNIIEGEPDYIRIRTFDTTGIEDDELLTSSSIRIEVYY